MYVGFFCCCFFGWLFFVVVVCLNTWIFPNKTKFCLFYSKRNIKKKRLQRKKASEISICGGGLCGILKLLVFLKEDQISVQAVFPTMKIICYKKNQPLLNFPSALEFCDDMIQCYFQLSPFDNEAQHCPLHWGFDKSLHAFPQWLQFRCFLLLLIF